MLALHVLLPECLLARRDFHLVKPLVDVVQVDPCATTPCCDVLLVPGVQTTADCPDLSQAIAGKVQVAHSSVQLLLSCTPEGQGKALWS